MSRREATRKGSIKRQNEFVYHANRERESTRKNLINYLPFGLISRKIATRVRTLRLVFPSFTLLPCCEFSCNGQSFSPNDRGVSEGNCIQEKGERRGGLAQEESGTRIDKPAMPASLKFVLNE